MGHEVLSFSNNMGNITKIYYSILQKIKLNKEPKVQERNPKHSREETRQTEEIKHKWEEIRRQGRDYKRGYIKKGRLNSVVTV